MNILIYNVEGLGVELRYQGYPFREVYLNPPSLIAYDGVLTLGVF